MPSNAQALVLQIISDGEQAALGEKEISENIMRSLINEGHISELPELGRIIGPLKNQNRTLYEISSGDHFLIGNKLLFERMLYDVKGEPDLSTNISEDLIEITKILLLRQLQEMYKETVSWDRIHDNSLIFGADDYSLYEILEDIYAYSNTKGYELEEYPQTIRNLVESVLGEYPFNKNSMNELEEFAINNGYLKNYVESPDILLDVYRRYPLMGGGVVRFAPTPNGPLSIGHGRGVSILSEYCDMYNMKFVLRFDDTDQDPIKSSDLPPEFGIPDVYSWIEEDVKWIKGDDNFKVVYASDRGNLDYYEKIVSHLIDEGLAFVVYQLGDKKDTKAFSFTRDKGLNERLFNLMKEGKLDLREEFPSMRAINKENKSIELMGDELIFDDAYILLPFDSIKTGYLINLYLLSQYDVGAVKETMKEALISPNLLKFNTLKSLRGTTKIMRLQKTQNKRVKERGETQYVWPTLRLQAPVDDYRYQITHNIRGPDYALAETLVKYNKSSSGKIKLSEEDRQNVLNAGIQGIIFKLIGGKHMEDLIVWGFVDDDGKPISTSKMKKRIISGELPPYNAKNPEGGFRNPSLPTIYSIRNRPKMSDWGRIFRTYWTRFKMPLILNPTYSSKEFSSYTNEIFMEYTNPKQLINDDAEIRNAIASLIKKNKYYAEEY